MAQQFIGSVISLVSKSDVRGVLALTASRCSEDSFEAGTC